VLILVVRVGYGLIDWCFVVGDFGFLVGSIVEVVRIDGYVNLRLVVL